MELSLGDYIPIFKRTDLAAKIHEEFGFRLDRELTSQKTSETKPQELNTQVFGFSHFKNCQT